MNPAIWICIYLPIFISIITALYYNKEYQKYIYKRIKNKKEGRTFINDMIKNYIGKECLIYTFQTQVAGVIESIEDNWISVKTAGASEIINIDYISRIREYPKNKNGKKKAFVAD